MVLPEEDGSESTNDGDVHSLSSTSHASGRLNPPANDVEKELRNKIINKEETNVRQVRWVLIAVGIACAVAVGVAVNRFAHQGEQESFELEVRRSGRRQRRNQPCYILSYWKRHH